MASERLSRKVNISKYWSCDFETTTDPEDCRVWAWVAINYEDTNIRYYGNDIGSFMKWCFEEKRECSFHNLKFDGEFIMYWALEHGFEYSPNPRRLNTREFSTLISNMGSWYTFSLCYKGITVRFVDSLKLLNFSVENLAKQFHLEISKLSIDYRAKREVGHQLTQEEKDYITNDALIVAQAMRIMRENGFDKITIGSNALHYYKRMLGGEDEFRKLFPVPMNDYYIRQSYKGGFTYVNEGMAGMLWGEGRVYDVNSLYPSVMHSPYLYPVGNGEYFVGAYEEDKAKPLYFQRFTCQFKLKEKHIPTIQIKHSFRFDGGEYLSTSGDEDVELVLTSVDLKLFFDQYDVYNYTPIDGYKYIGVSGLFDNYIDYWYNEKAESRRRGDKVMTLIAKLMLNSFYGKFGTNPDPSAKKPVLKDGVMTLEEFTGNDIEPVYIPVACFVTAYGRDKIIRSAQSVYNRFIYCDTDSLHLLGNEDVPEIDVDQFRLGAFKHEANFSEGKYLRSKLYMEHLYEPDNPNEQWWMVTGAGMTPKIKEQVNIDNFDFGLSIAYGKLRPVHCKGGIVLVDTPFTIKE